MFDRTATINHCFGQLFSSTTTHVNDIQQRFLNRLILEIENALLFTFKLNPHSSTGVTNTPVLLL